MTHKILRSLVLYGLLLVLSTEAMAQSDGISPLSRLGLGELSHRTLSARNLMGGLAAAYHDPFRPDITNPASLGWLEVTAFDVGVNATRSRLTEGEQSARYWSGAFDELTLSIPIYNPLNEIIENEKYPFRWGAQIALKNNSRSSYDILTSELDPALGPVQRQFTGSGGSYKLHVNNGFRFNNTSFGVGLGFLFGNISFDRFLTLQGESEARRTHLTRSYSLSGFQWNIGVQHDINLRRPVDDKVANARIPKIQLGASFHTSTGFSTRRDELTLGEVFIAGQGYVVADTITSLLDTRGSGTLPAEFNIGAIYNSGRSWQLGIDYYYAPWSSYENEAQPDVLQDAWRWSIGGSYLPNPQSFRRLFSRSQYKWGAFYAKDPRVFGGDQVKHYGITLGVELPFVFQRQFSFLNLGVEMGRYDLENRLQQNYVKISLAATGNSNQWFLKRKYN